MLFSTKIKAIIMLRSFQSVMPKIEQSAYVDETALVIGDVSIGEDSSIWPFTCIRGDVNYIRIGRKTNIQDGSVLHVTHKYKGLEDGYALSIGNEVTIGHKVILHGCQIANQVLIGMGAILLDGVKVEDKVLIGAGSVVTEGKYLESGFLWYGSPAKKIRELNEKELQWFSYSANHYVKLKNLTQLGI